MHTQCISQPQVYIDNTCIVVVAPEAALVAPNTYSDRARYTAYSKVGTSRARASRLCS